MDLKRNKALLIIIPTIIVLVLLTMAKFMTRENYNTSHNSTVGLDTINISHEREYLIKEAVKKAYTLWYQIDADNFETNIKDALFYFGDCGQKMLKEYNDEKVSKILHEKELLITVKILEVKLNTQTHKGFIKGVQTINRSNGKIKRNVFASFIFSSSKPSENNPFGVIFENWKVYNNDILKN